MSAPLLVVIVNYKTARLTVNCLRSLEPELADIPGARVAVVENASGDAEALADAIEENGWGDWVRLDVADRNGGFAFGNNVAIRPALASGDPPRYILLLNADTEVYPGAVRTLLEFLDARPDVGIAGSRFENADGSEWALAFRFFSARGEFEQGAKFGPVSRLLKDHAVARVMEPEEAPVDWICGASMLIRREVFEDVGLMDEGYFLYYEETDFCLRARRAGWPCWYVPRSRVLHIGGQSTGVTVRGQRPPRTPTYWFESRRRYYLKNHGLARALAADLAFCVGHSLHRLRRAVLRQPDDDPPRMLLDFLSHSVLFRRNRRLADVPGTPGGGRIDAPGEPATADGQPAPVDSLR